MTHLKRKPHFSGNKDEAITALDFYKQIVQALRGNGVRKILISINSAGELDANIIQAAKSPCVHKGPL